MVQRYTYLVARGWTEKEKVARRRQAEEARVEDEVASRPVGWRQAWQNWRYFWGYQIPDSIFVVKDRVVFKDA